MNKRIFIYEDDLDTLLVCKLILEEQKYFIETRLTCTNIIEDIDKIRPDLVLMDLWIPKLGGENAIRLVREQNRYRHIPIIVFSANSEAEIISMRIKADGFIRKPFIIHIFSRIIASFLADN